MKRTVHFSLIASMRESPTSFTWKAPAMLAVWWTLVSSLPSWSSTDPQGESDLEATATSRSPGISKMSTVCSTTVSKRDCFFAGSKTTLASSGVATRCSCSGWKGFAAAGQAGATEVPSFALMLGSSTTMVPSSLGVIFGSTSTRISTVMCRFASSAGSCSASPVTTTCVVLSGAVRVGAGAASAGFGAGGAGSGAGGAGSGAGAGAGFGSGAGFGAGAGASAAASLPGGAQGMNLPWASSRALPWFFSLRMSSMSLQALRPSGSRESSLNLSENLTASSRPRNLAMRRQSPP
mmetsp:Transcript_46806/g.135408  ORF Transcript_46806/g.135408 Transcript_46806/m.135408 type:complete len:293 (-) Transcript_46806:317-1195(-)